jgi:hypothetical protein
MNQTIKAGIDTANMNLQQLIKLVTIPATSVETQLSPGLSAVSLATPSPSLSPPTSTQNNLPLSSITMPSAQTWTLQLGDGTILTVTEADIPNPPAVPFASDLPRLNCMWDDTSIHWD